MFLRLLLSLVFLNLITLVPSKIHKTPIVVITNVGMDHPRKVAAELEVTNVPIKHISPSINKMIPKNILSNLPLAKIGPMSTNHVVKVIRIP